MPPTPRSVEVKPRKSFHPYHEFPRTLLALLFLLSLLSAGCSSVQAGSNFQASGAQSQADTGHRISISATLPAATVGLAYNKVLSVSGGTSPYQFSVTAGSLPPGLQLNASTGSISGTPAVAGTFSFRILVTDLPKRDRGDANLSLAVIGAVPHVAVTVAPSATTVASGQTQLFAAAVSGSSNTAVTWSASAGSISSSGLFTAPVVSQTQTVTVTAASVADPSETASASVTVTSPAPPPPSIVLTVAPNAATVASGQTQLFTATVSGSSNTSVTWSAGAGSISSSGLFTAPVVSQTQTVTVTAASVADPSKTASASVSVTAPPPPAALTITTSSLPSGADGTPYAATLTAAGGALPYQWSVASGSLPQGIALNSASGLISGATSQSGNFTFTAKVSDTASNNATQTFTLSFAAQGSGNYDGPAELPRVYVQSSMADTPAPGGLITVNAGGNLQTALNNANCGDIIELQAGATFTGVFTLPANSCDDNHWIIIRTSAPDSSLPPEGTRITPCYAGVSSLPGRPALNCSSTANVMPKILAGGNNAFLAANGANHYRLIGLEVTHLSGMPTNQPDTLISLGGTPVAHHIIIDRCWIHGTATDFLKRGIRLSGDYLAVVDSTVTDVHAVATATQGILSGTGNGPLKISNNFVEGGDSAIGFGGQANTNGNPSDVEITHNHLFKPWSWRYGDPSYLGFAFSAKVALESKNSVRVLVEGNIMENTWGDAPGGPHQGGDGSIAWLGPKNQGNQCPTCDVSDVTVRHNIFRHAGAGLYIFDGVSDAGGIALQASRFSIHDNLFDDINSSYAGNGSGNGILNRFGGSTTYLPPRDVVISHNTGLSVGANNALLSLNTSSAAPYQNFTFQDNLESYGRYGVEGCQGQYGVSVLNNCVPGFVFNNNALIGGSASSGLSGNYFPAGSSAVLFANYNNGNGGDYRLCQGPSNPAPSCTTASPYVGKGTDGRDLGADINLINSATAGVD